MSGFKCFEDTVKFQLGDMTLITASNGQGKSSIADAIAFAFVGTPFFGDRGLDRLQNKNTDEMTVSVDFIDDKGGVHNLTRTRKHENTAISYDGLNVRQSDLNTVFGDKDIFLSILNPLYFISVLGESGKSLFEKLLPVVKHEEVMAALSESSQKTLANQQFSSPETFIRNRRSELKELEETLIGYRGKKELLDRQCEERTANIGKLRVDIDKITNEMTKLTVIRDKGHNVLAEESELSKLRKRRGELLSDAAQNGTDKTMQNLMNEIKAVEKSIVKYEATAYASIHAAKIAEAEAGINLLYNEHSKVKTSLSNTVIGYKCPTCAVMITAGNIESIKADLQKRLEAFVNEGKIAKNNLAEIKAQDSTAKREFEKQKETVLTAERNKLTALTQRLQEMNIAREMDAEDYGEQLTAIESQISAQEYRLANGNLTPEQIRRFAELDNAKKENEIKVEALNNIAANDYAALIVKTESEITQLKRLINEVINYTAKRIELMFGGLTMSNTEIVLTEIIKSTGEVKDCFRFSYDGRDYKYLSLSEKVRAGLEIGTLIQHLSGRKYPIFIDNTESICSVGDIQLSGQVIFSRVVKNQALQVTYKNREKLKTA